jgi:hypothetical protein
MVVGEDFGFDITYEVRPEVDFSLYVVVGVDLDLILPMR